MNLKRVALAAVTIGVAVVAASALATPANATTGDFRGTGIHIHNAPHVSATVVGEANHGDRYTMTTNVYGDTVNCPGGWQSPWWGLVRDTRTGASGYVSDCYL